MKNLTLIITLFSIAYMTSSCKQENMDADNLNVLFDFSIVDEQGNDLIREGLIIEDKINVYHKGADGEYQNYYQSHLAYPKGIKISESLNAAGKYVFLFYASDDRINNVSSHIVEWGIEGFKKDTFDCIFFEGDLFLREVKLNGEPFWESNSGEYATLVKSLE